MRNNSTGKLGRQNRYINMETCNSSNGRFVRKVGKVSIMSGLIREEDSVVNTRMKSFDGE